MLGNYYGRITAPVMWFILAKMTLNAEIWTDDIWTDDQHLEGDNILFTIAGEQMTAWEACIYYCGLLTNFGYKLEPTYSTNFNTRNESSLENIFTIPMDKTLYTNQFKYLFRSRHNNHGAALGMASATAFAVRIDGTYTIVLPTYEKSGIAADLYKAADVLREALKTGAGLDLATDRAEKFKGGKAIYIGEAAAKKAGLVPGDMKDFSSVIAEKGGDIYLFATTTSKSDNKLFICRKIG
jgi:hypothetical protein